MTPNDISLLFYNLAILPVLFFSILFFILTLLNIFVDAPQKKGAIKNKAFPLVSVQIPSYNDIVAARCIEACLKLDYPKDRFQIMVLDDSTDTRTQKLLKSFQAKYAGRVEYIHRTNRTGYKPGALLHAMPKTKGDIIVIFDADFMPHKDFLKRAVMPFENPEVAIVQGQQVFHNRNTNLISRFASYLLMTYQTIVMPINNKANTVFFGGTAGAIRKSALVEAGGWNINSITEDSDLSVRILAKGYKSVYMPFETSGEVPITIESFLKQQMRWCYGNVRVWIDHKSSILYKRGLTFRQRLMISFNTMGNFVAPAVILMTIAGFTGWFFGDPHLVTLGEVSTFFIKFFYTAGFLIMATVTLYKHKSLREFPQLLLATISISIILAMANTIAVFKAVCMPNAELFPRKHTSWICTEKQGNNAYMK